jgi:sulfide:quinone oxidoreductase
VVVVGGGVAALEAVSALARFASDLTDVIVVAPDQEFSDMPRTVWEPLVYRTARRYPVAAIAHAAGADVLSADLSMIDRSTQTVHTTDGQVLQYDALVLALGAKVIPRHNQRVDDRWSSLRRALSRRPDVEGGYTRRIASSLPDAWKRRSRCMSSR